MSGIDQIQTTNTLNEILSQPRCWEECFQALQNYRPAERVAEQLNPNAVCLFIGCGSSYYVAQAAAASWTHITGMRARAVPASELLLFPELVLMRGVNYQPVLISRSGNTSEVLQAA